MRTWIKGEQKPWPKEVWLLFVERVVPLIKEGEYCSMANYFVPRPYKDEYNLGSDTTGFVYTMQPGDRVAFLEWIPD